MEDKREAVNITDLYFTVLCHIMSQAAEYSGDDAAIYMTLCLDNKLMVNLCRSTSIIPKYLHNFK